MLVIANLCPQGFGTADEYELPNPAERQGSVIEHRYNLSARVSFSMAERSSLKQIESFLVHLMGHRNIISGDGINAA
jgi:hypothetical protein